jgi:hypothetical protein
MPRGGYRPGAGRPRKVMEPQGLPLPTPAGYRRNSVEPVELTGIEYLKRLVNDMTADPARRDRAAGVLASIEFRSGKVATGKKVLREEAAQRAGWGTEWYALLHDPSESHFDPNGLTPEDRAEYERNRAKSPPRKDNTNWDRYLRDADEPKATDWTDPATGLSDLQFNPRGYPYPPDDE